MNVKYIFNFSIHISFKNLLLWETLNTYKSKSWFSIAQLHQLSARGPSLTPMQMGFPFTSEDSRKAEAWVTH